MRNWTMDLESDIFTILKVRFPAEVKQKYPLIRFTTEENNDNEPVFPTVLIRLLPMAERGMDLEGQSINAVLATVQVDIATNSAKRDAEEIAGVMVGLLKEMRFEMIAMPDTTKSDDVYRSVIRGRRMIGSGDTL